MNTHIHTTEVSWAKLYKHKYLYMEQQEIKKKIYKAIDLQRN